MSKAKNDERVTVPVGTDLKEQLRLIGARNGRNLTSTLEHALKVYVALHDQEGNMKCSIDNILLGQQIRFGTAEEMQNQFEMFMGYVKELRGPAIQTVSKNNIDNAYVEPQVEVQAPVEVEDEVEVVLDF